MSRTMEALKGIAQGVFMGLLFSVPFIVEMFKEHTAWWT